METQGQSAAPAVDFVERRIHPRFDVDENSVLLVVRHGLAVQCRVLNVSLGGCCLYVTEKIPVRNHARVEVTFRVNGIPFRFTGVTLWTDGNHQIGIRFLDIPARRKAEYAQALDEIQAALEAKAAREAAASSPEAEAAPEAVSDPAPKLALPPSDAQIVGNGERRAHPRFEIHTFAAIFLVKLGLRLEGRILDLSQGGCRICTDVLFPVGIYTRVEVEFRIDGLPFRLGGVVQVVHDKNTVGIRFLDVSERKRQQLTILIQEILEAHKQSEAIASSELV